MTVTDSNTVTHESEKGKNLTTETGIKLFLYEKEGTEHLLAVQRRRRKDLGPQCLVQRTPTPVHWGHFRFGYLRWGSESPWPGAASVPAQALGALCLFLSSMQGDHEIRTIRWDKEGEDGAESQQH